MDTACYFTPITSNQTADDFFKIRFQALTKAFEHISDESLLLMQPAMLVTTLTTQFRLEPLRVQYDLLTLSNQICVVDSLRRSSLSSSEKTLQVILFHLPYLGSIDMLTHITARCYPQGTIKGRVTDQQVIIELNNTRRESNWLKGEKHRMLDLVASVVAWCNREVDDYNQNLPGHIERMISTRITCIQAKQQTLQENQQILVELSEPYLPPPIALPPKFEPFPNTALDDDWEEDE